MREYLAFDSLLWKMRRCWKPAFVSTNKVRTATFIIDRHPLAENVWLLSGGSGHGFKHGPAIGEMMAELVLKDREADPIFRLARLRSGCYWIWITLSGAFALISFTRAITLRANS